MTPEAAIEEVRALHNHICILFDSELVRVIGFHEDALDYYYHVRYKDGREGYCTFVGWCVSLKGIYDRHDILSDQFAREGCPPSPEFIISKATDEENLALYGRMNIEDQP